jgi:hypothetical protein
MPTYNSKHFTVKTSLDLPDNVSHIKHPMKREDFISERMYEIYLEIETMFDGYNKRLSDVDEINMDELNESTKNIVK